MGREEGRGFTFINGQAAAQFAAGLLAAAGRRGAGSGRGSIRRGKGQTCRQLSFCMPCSVRRQAGGEAKPRRTAACLAVAQGDATGGVRGGQLPGWIHHDDVELGAAHQLRPVVGGDVGVDRNAVGGDLRADGRTQQRQGGGAVAFVWMPAAQGVWCPLSTVCGRLQRPTLWQQGSSASPGTCALW